MNPNWREAAAKSKAMANPKKQPSDVAGGSRTKQMFTKDEVAYEHPAKKSDHCGICKSFMPMHRCQIVAGYIRKGDWCSKWSAR